MFSTDGYDAFRHAVAVVRRDDRGVLLVRGADRATWLQGLVTNDVLSLAPGQRIYGAYLTPQGRMMTDLWVVAASGSLLLDVPAPLTASLAERLDGLIFAEDVQVEDASAAMAPLHMLGPGIGGLTSGEAPLPDAGGAAPVGVLVPDATYGVPGLVAYGGLEALLDASGLARLAEAPRVGLDTFEVLRIEAGVPRFLVDMTTDTIPLEAGIEDRAISFTKGCYVGQEIIVRVTTRGGGRVAKKLVGLTLSGKVTSDGDDRGETQGTPGEPRVRTTPLGWAISSGDRAIGHVTSEAYSPTVSAHIALGYVHRDFVAPGTRVQVVTTAGPVDAVVAVLPFVRAGA